MIRRDRGASVKAVVQGMTVGPNPRPLQALNLHDLADRPLPSGAAERH
jgi:hypothetical protein